MYQMQMFSAETPKTAMLAPIQFGEQLKITMTWVKRFFVNLKALYKLGEITKSNNGRKNTLKFGWDIAKAVLATIDSYQGNYQKAAKNDELTKLAFHRDLLLERF